MIPMRTCAASSSTPATAASAKHQVTENPRAHAKLPDAGTADPSDPVGDRAALAAALHSWVFVPYRQLYDCTTAQRWRPVAAPGAPDRDRNPRARIAEAA